MLTLGIMRSTHSGATQFLFQNPGILTLEALRCRISHIGIALMPVQTPEEYFLPVQIKSITVELGYAEAEFYFPYIGYGTVLQGHPAGVTIRILQGPETGIR